MITRSMAAINATSSHVRIPKLICFPLDRLKGYL